MASSKINYSDKVSLTTSPLPRANKCTAEDLNEIKQVINDNADIQDTLSDDLNNMEQNFNNNNTFSTTEKEIGTWIDGKKIYRKSYTGSVVDASSNAVNLFNIDVDYDNIWIDESHSYLTNNNESLTLNFYYTTGDYARSWIRKSDSVLRFKSGMNLSGRTFVITLLYTKTN